MAKVGYASVDGSGRRVASRRRASAVFKAAFNIAHAAERSETEPRSLGTETGRDEVERRAAGYDSPAIRHDLNLQFFEPASLRASGDTHGRPTRGPSHAPLWIHTCGS